MNYTRLNLPSLFLVLFNGWTSSAQTPSSNLPPAFTATGSPTSQTVVISNSISLTTSMIGTAPIAFQWFLDGQAVENATNRSLSLSRVQPEQEGLYCLVASNPFGMATSLVARVNVVPPPTSLLARIYTNASQAKLPYRLFVPTNDPAGQVFPLVIFLHGIGERGSDNIAQVRAQPHCLSFVSYENQRLFPTCFVAPQCPSSRTWSDAVMVEQVGDLIEALVAEYPIDTNRLYITGLSMGGYGTWSLLDAAPTAFAAALPVCGGGSTDRCTNFMQVAIWDFHAADDGSVPVNESRRMIAALRLKGGTPIYTEYRSGGHGIWANAYSTPGIVAWTMAQRRGSPSPVAPLLELTQPVTNLNLATSATSISCAGMAQSGSALVPQVSWTNLILRVGGAVTGDSFWTANDIPLKSEWRNPVVFLGSTISWAPSLGGSTTFNRTLLVDTVPGVRLVLTRQDSQLLLSWTGGLPPFELQRCDILDSGNWLSEAADVTSPLHIEGRNPAAFFRILSH
jgi:poly(3-hydroxybutyrate) depolymerase